MKKAKAKAALLLVVTRIPHNLILSYAKELSTFKVGDIMRIFVTAASYTAWSVVEIERNEVHNEFSKLGLRGTVNKSNNEKMFSFRYKDKPVAILTYDESTQTYKNLDITVRKVEKTFPSFLLDYLWNKGHVKKSLNALFNAGICYQGGKMYDGASLPKGFTVKETLDLWKRHNVTLPEGLTVKGDLYLPDFANSNFEVMPKNIRVEGDLDLSNTKIKHLSEGLYVGGSLLLQQCPLTKLPDDLYVGGNLDLTGTGISILPAIHVEGDVYPSENLTAIDKGVYVGGTLDTTYTKYRMYYLENPENYHIEDFIYKESNDHL